MPRYHYDAEDNRAEEIDPGEYMATIVSAQDKIAKTSGNEMIEICWAVNDNGCRIYDYLTFTEKTAFRIDTFLQACGHAPERAGVDVELNAAEMVGWRAWVKVGLVPDSRDASRKQNKIVQYIIGKPVLPGVRKVAPTTEPTDTDFEVLPPVSAAAETGRDDFSFP